MNQIPLLSLFSDLRNDAREPGLIWQLAIIVAVIGATWVMSRVLRAFLIRRDPDAPLHVVHSQKLINVVATGLTLVLLMVGKYVLHTWYHVHLLSVAIPLVASLALVRAGFFLTQRVFARHGHISAAMDMAAKLFSGTVWIGVALYITGLWPDLLRFLDDTVVPLGRNQVSLEAILQGAVSVAVLLMLALWAGAALDEKLMKMDGLHMSMRVVLARMGRALLILVALLVSLSLCGIDLTVLSVFGGALGVGLGLGLQKIASNYVSGFIILLDRSLAIGNMISVGASSGRVTHINTRYTVLQGLDGVETIVPNEMLVSGVVLNSSLSNSMTAASTTVAVGYESDVDQVLVLLAEAAASAPRVSTVKAPSASLVSFGDSGLNMKVSFWVDDVENGTSGAVAEVNLAIWRTLKKNAISIPFPQSEVRIIGVPAGAPTPATGVLTTVVAPQPQNGTAT